MFPNDLSVLLLVILLLAFIGIVLAAVTLASMFIPGRLPILERPATRCERRSAARAARKHKTPSRP